VSIKVSRIGGVKVTAAVLTLIITEGFGRMEMAAKAFDLLQSRKGMKASINGATQIRAGVIRPEVVVPIRIGEENHRGTEARRECKGEQFDPSVSPHLRGRVPPTDAKESEGQLVIGAEVRIIREPHFGELAEVMDLPAELQELETEARVRVLKVKLKRTGENAILPRANVEIVSQ